LFGYRPEQGHLQQNAVLRQTDRFDNSSSFNYLVSRAGLEPKMGIDGT